MGSENDFVFEIFWIAKTLWTGIHTSELGRSHPTNACPDSWNAITRRSTADNACDRFSVPPTTRSTAYSKFFALTDFWLVLAACRAASLQTLAMSAPEKPGVKIANLCEYVSGVFSSRIPVKCFSKISLRSLNVGRSIVMCRSNRPGRRSAYKRNWVFNGRNSLNRWRLHCLEHRHGSCWLTLTPLPSTPYHPFRLVIDWGSAPIHRNWIADLHL